MSTFEIITDKSSVATKSIKGKERKLLNKIRIKTIKRIATQYDIPAERLTVLWVPEKCDSTLFQRPCCGSLFEPISSSGRSLRKSTSSMIASNLCNEDEYGEADYDEVGDSASSWDASRYRRQMVDDCDILGSIMIEEMEDGNDRELLHLLCGCYLKEVSGTDSTNVIVTMYGFTHVSDMTLHGAEHMRVIRGNPSRFEADTKEPADRIIEVLNHFQVPIYTVLKRIDEAREALLDTPGNSLDSDCDSDLDPTPQPIEVDSDNDDDGYDSPPPRRSTSSRGTRIPFHLGKIRELVDEPKSFKNWIYIPIRFDPTPGEEETIATSGAFQERVKIILSTAVELSVDNFSALQYVRKRNMTYSRPECMQMDRTIITYLALAVFHVESWSEVFIDGISRLCEHLYDNAGGITAKEDILRINHIRLKPIDIRSVEESHGRLIREQCRESLTELVDMWRTLMKVNLDRSCATLWPKDVPPIIEKFLTVTWTYLEENV